MMMRPVLLACGVYMYAPGQNTVNSSLSQCIMQVALVTLALNIALSLPVVRLFVVDGQVLGLLLQKYSFYTWS